MVENEAEKHKFSEVDRLIGEVISRVNMLDIRDGDQPANGNRMDLADLIEIAKEQDKLVGMLKEDDFENIYTTIQTMMGGKHDSFISFLGEDIFQACNEIYQNLDHVRMSGLWRSDKGVLYTKGEPELQKDISSLYSENGYRGADVYNYANDMSAFKTSVEAYIERRILEHEKGVPDDMASYFNLMISVNAAKDPNELEKDKTWNNAAYKEKIIEFHKMYQDDFKKLDDLGINHEFRITAKDAIGVTGYNLADNEQGYVENSQEVVDLLEALKDAHEEAKEKGLTSRDAAVVLHSHCCGKSKAELFAELFEKTEAIFDVCNGDLSYSDTNEVKHPADTSHTRLIDLIDAVMEKKGFSREDYQDSKYFKQVQNVEEAANRNTHKYLHRRNPEKQTIPEMIKTGVGGGAFNRYAGEIKKAIKVLKKHDDIEISYKEFKELSDLIAEEIKDIIGDPQTLTPYSKNAGDNSVMIAQTAVRNFYKGTDKNDIKQANKDIELLKERMTFSQIPLAGNLTPHVLKHIASEYGEDDRGYKTGKGDVAIRDVAIFVRTFTLPKSGNDFYSGTLHRLEKQDIIDGDMKRAITKAVRNVDGAKELMAAYQNPEELQKLRDRLIDIPGQKAKGFENDALKNIQDFLQDINKNGIEINGEKVKLSNEATKVLMASVKPGKIEVPRELESQRRDWGYTEAKKEIGRQIDAYKDSDGKMKITLPIVDFDKTKLDTNEQFKITGIKEYEGKAVDLKHVATLLASGRQNTAIDAVQFQHDGIRRGSIEWPRDPKAEDIIKDKAPEIIDFIAEKQAKIERLKSFPGANRINTKGIHTLENKMSKAMEYVSDILKENGYSDNPKFSKDSLQRALTVVEGIAEGKKKDIKLSNNPMLWRSTNKFEKQFSDGLQI